MDSRFHYPGGTFVIQPTRRIHLISKQQESPPTLTQEAYRLLLIKYYMCSPVPGGYPAGGTLGWGTPVLTCLGGTPLSPCQGYPLDRPGWGTPPRLDLAGVPPPSVDRLKTLPSPIPSDAVGKNQ